MSIAGSGWDEYITAASCQRIYDEQQMDSTAFAAERARQEQRITVMAPNAVEQPKHVARTRQYVSDMPRLMPKPWSWGRR